MILAIVIRCELKPDEAWLTLCDFLTGDFIIPKTSSVFWKEYRKKWVMVFEQIYGTSWMGEVWYAEGDTPTGPWVYARKIVTHDNYTFYNVGQHPLFDQDIRLQVKSPDHQVKPLFYGIPDSNTTDKMQDGTWECEFDEGVFSGNHTVITWKQLLSPMIIPLYEFRDQDGFYSYSIEKIIQ